MAKHATTAETIQIHEILKRVLIVKEGGLCSYIPGYNDEKVASEISPNVSKNSVMHVRTQLFGNLFNRTESPPEENDIEKRVSEAIKIAKNAERLAEDIVRNLGKHIDDINKLAGDLDQRFDKLITMLALNRVVDCKHLGTPHKNGEKK